jgi:hypothetical protein
MAELSFQNVDLPHRVGLVPSCTVLVTVLHDGALLSLGSGARHSPITCQKYFSHGSGMRLDTVSVENEDRVCLLRVHPL